MTSFWRFDPALFGGIFGLIFLAELPDKTAFATLVLATRKNPVAVFMGVAAAFVIQTVVAVTFGSALSLLPARAVRLGAGLAFFAFAAAMWLRREDVQEPCVRAEGGASHFYRTVWTSFVVIFIAEWGDMTQLATAAMTAKHGQPLTIFCAATLALWSVTGIAVFVGNRVKGHFHPQFLQRVAAVVLALVGLVCLWK